MKIKMFCMFCLHVISVNTFCSDASMIENRLFKLKSMWNHVIQNSIQIQEQNMHERDALIKTKSLEGYYSPSINIENSITSSEASKDSEYPESLSNSISYVQLLPGGTSIGISTSINTSYINNLETMYVQQVPSVNFVVEQSLFPFYFQKKSYDPVKMNYRNNYKIEQIEKRMIIQESIIKLTQLYINMRIQKRQIEIYKEYLVYFDLEEKANEQLYKDSRISYSKIIEIRQNKLDYQAELDELLLSYLLNEKDFKAICDYSLDSSLFDELPDYSSEIIKLYRGGYHTNEEQILMTQKQSLLNTQINRKQNYAPKLGIEFTPSLVLDQTKLSNWKNSWTKDTSQYSWALSVYLDISDFIVSKVKKDNDLEMNQIDFVDKQIDSNQIQWEASCNELRKSLSIYNSKLEQFEKINQELRKLYDDILSLHEEEKVSEIEYRKVELQKNNQRSLIENTKDMIWFYKFVMYLKEIDEK